MEFIQFLGLLDNEFEVDLSKTNYELFEEHFNAINQCTIRNYIESKSSLSAKSVSKAEKYRADGNAVYKLKNYGKAMDLYNLSLGNSPRDSLPFGYALANRSAILFDLKYYKECLLDIQNVFNTKYPLFNYYKIFIRQANCLFELNAFDEATTAIENARSSFKSHKMQISASNHTAILEKIIRVAERIRFGRKDQVNEEVKYEENDALPSLKNGENPNFIDASSAVDIKTNSRQGRHVVANCDIEKGDILFVEKAYSFAVLKSLGRPINYCQNCLKFSLICLPCLSCPLFFFCSDACRETSWSANHQWTCAGTRKNLLTNEMYLALNVVFRASRTGLKTVVNDATVFGNKADNYPYLSTLVTHRGKGLVLDLSAAVYLVVYLMHETDFFDWLYAQPNRPNLTRRSLILTVGTYIVKHLRQCLFNVNRISELHLGVDDLNMKLISVSLEDTAYGIYVSSALLNHSCIPNTTECYEKDVKIVKATENIQKGTEVTVSYIVEHYIETNSEMRKLVLKDRYGFTCACLACTDSCKTSLLEAWLCPKCKGPAVAYGEQRKARCESCRFKFKIRIYIEQEKEFLHQYVNYGLLRNLHSLEAMEHIMKQIYSSKHFMVLRVYSLLLNFHFDKKNIKKGLEYYKLLLHTDTVLEENAFIADWAKYSYLLAKYCKSLPNKQSMDYSETYKKAKDAIDYLMKMLHIYSNQRCADNIYQSLTNYLNSDGPLQFDYMFGRTLFLKE